MLNDFPIIRDAFPRTIRLVSTARLRDSVLRGLVDDDELDLLFEIEGATSARLRAQDGGLESVYASEFVYGVPHATFINASFAYSKPLELNRFNGPGRGAWYASLEVETCIKEVSFHMAEFLSRVSNYHATVDYAELHASMAGEYVDLRGADPHHPCLDPDPSVGYPAGNALADAARAKGLNGIIYPSVRHAGGICLAALWPHAVQSVAPGCIYRMIWSGQPEPSVQKLDPA